jgi:lipopolysaccharide transport system permease protein
MSMKAERLPVRLIQPARAWVPLDLAELWEYRELLWLLVWRELKVRYKQTILGVAWAILQPFLTMLVFSVVFGRLAKIPSDGVPYPVFAYCALLPWQLFAFAMTESSNSLVAHQRLLTKVYFPRLMMPLAAVAVGLADFLVSFVFLLMLMAYYGMTPHLTAVTIPVWTLLALGTAFGVGLWLSALNVRYRDVRYTLPFLSQFWMYATPVAYPLSLLPERWRPLVALNPMAGVVEGFRWALLGGRTAPDASLLVSIVTVVVVMVGGLFYFRRTERTLADVL